MDAQIVTAIRTLLDTTRVLSLAVVVDDEPDAGLLPFAVRADYTQLYVQASGLARHTRGLTPGATVGLLVHEPDAADRDPMQLVRLTVRAEVSVLERGTEAFTAAAVRFVARFPAAETTLALGKETFAQSAPGG